MKSPTPPAAPDPAISIAEQGRQNRINTVSPFGTTKYTVGPAGNQSDLSDITRTDTLNPSQQRQFDARNRLGETLLGQAESQVQQFDPNQFEFRGADSGQNETFNRQVALLEPEFAKQEERLMQDLANRGIPEGSELFDEQLQKLRDDQGRTLSGVASQADQTGFAQAVSTRQQRFNELAAQLGGQQLTPQNVQTQNIDVQGAFNAQQAAKQAAFEAESIQASAFNEGLFGLGSAAIGASDRRLKTNIKRIGTHALGIGYYVFDYLWGERAEGVMADEVRTVMPKAVLRMSGGYDMVHYGMIGREYA